MKNHSCPTLCPDLDEVPPSPHAAPWPVPDDALLARATALLQGERSVTISCLQRHLRLGYRAALGLRAALVQQGAIDPPLACPCGPESESPCSEGIIPTHGKPEDFA